jgi:hypothetical protein
MATKRRPAPAPVDETTLYMPPDVAIVAFGDQRFRVGKMPMGASMRFTRLMAGWLTRAQSTIAAIQAIDDATERDRATATLNWIDLLPEHDLAELLAIALSSNADAPVTAAWVQEQWDFGQAMDVLDAWLARNAIADYIARLGKLMQTVTRTMPPTPPAGSTTPTV